jgi:heavy metal translocating P-type ATPase
MNGLRRDPLLLATLAFLLAGLALYARPELRPAARLVWFAGLVLGGGPIVWRTARGALRGRFAADLVASLAIVTAVLLQEPFAGLIIVLMQTGGEALERYAERRASQAVRELEAAAPRTAHRIVDDGVEDIAAEDVAVGDLLLVRPGELVPADGLVMDGRSDVDASQLTGEAVPIAASPGVALLSGSLNGTGALTLRATRRSSESQYARIVELVRTAQASRAPLQRVADRYAVWFTPITLLVCAVAWALSGDPLRVLAVLVVATPCPLILATPVAIIGGINRAARHQIIVRTGGALERLANIDVAVFDKTGTLTVGRPRVARVDIAPGFRPDDVLRLAGAVEERSSHLLARTLVEHVRTSGLELPVAADIVEAPGRGVRGTVAGRSVVVGARDWVASLTGAGEAAALARLDGDGPGLRAWIAIDGRAAGVVFYDDAIRPGLAGFFDDLRTLGVRRTLLLSGDRTVHAEAVAATLGIAEVRGGLLPEDKTRIVQELEDAGHRVLMVGDGTNDAPALGTASVGIALAGHGGGITAEAADAVLLVDDPTRVAHAIRIGRRSMRIARQSIRVGLGLSGLAMLFAAAGHIPPAVGALLQEAIDVAVILNALRASGAVTTGPAAPPRV